MTAWWEWFYKPVRKIGYFKRSNRACSSLLVCRATAVFSGCRARVHRHTEAAEFLVNEVVVSGCRDQRDADDGLFERQDDDRIDICQPCTLKQDLRRRVE